MTNKLNLMEKEFTRYKAQSKEEIDRNEKTMEEMEGKISEVSGESIAISLSSNLTFFLFLGSKEC